MSESHLSTLAETIGVVRAAHHVLNADSLSVEQEAFLREHYHHLSAEYLLCWLGHDDPCETESERPNTRIVERVVDQLGETGGLLLTADPRLLEAVHDHNVRDEITTSPIGAPAGC